MPPLTDLFLSYPHADKQAVLDLAEALRAEGLILWMDESNVGAFEHIHDRVASGIAGSRAVLAWYSQHYAASRPCQWELGAAYLYEDGERILVLNPEQGDGHIQPRTLLERLYVPRTALCDLPAVARQIKSHVARFASPIGDSISFSQPLHYGRQLTGSNHFVGRLEQFWKIHKALSESRATMLTQTVRSVAQLRGFGGVGKSMLAEEYALRFGAAYPGGIFWLKAYGNDDHRAMQPKDRDDERLRQVSDFASQLHVPTQGMPPPEIQSALARVLAADFGSGRRSLWIVDDLPSGLSDDALSQWLSPHKCVPTLITTRDCSHSSRGELIDVDTLSDEESFALLESHRHVEDSERQAAREVLDTLGHHALAVEVTASYLADQRSVSFQEFIEELRAPGEDVLEEAADLADVLPLDHSPSIVATLTGTIRRLSEPAADLLCLASCLSTAPLPKELIEAVFARLYGAASASSQRKKAAKETLRFSLSRKESAPPDALSVHRLVARTARRHPDYSDRLGRIQAAATASLNEVLLRVFSLGSVLRQSLMITHARALCAHLTTAAEALLLVLVANTDLRRGDLETAERLARRALDYCRAELGEDSLETSCAESGVAMVLLARGDGAGAREILEAVVPVFERSMPPGNIFRVGAQLGLALAVAAQGDLPLARRQSETALAACASSNGPDHPLTLDAKIALASILQIQGDLPGVMRLQQEVTEARRRIADSQDVDRLTEEILMAEAKMVSGEIESAAPEIENAVEVLKQQLGEDSILTLNARFLQLLLMGSRGDVSGVRQLASEIIPRFEQIFGPKNPATLQARCVEATAFLCAGDTGTWLSLIEPVLPDLEAVLGPEHSEVLSAKLGLAQARHSNGDSDGARRILDSLIPAAEARLGPTHTVTLNARDCLALCLFSQGDRAGACEVWEKVAALREGLLGSDHPLVLNTKVLIAQTLTILGQRERCDELLRQVIPLAESRLGPEHKVTLMLKQLQWRPGL